MTAANCILSAKGFEATMMSWNCQPNRPMGGRAMSDRVASLEHLPRRRQRRTGRWLASRWFVAWTALWLVGVAAPVSAKPPYKKQLAAYYGRYLSETIVKCTVCHLTKEQIKAHTELFTKNNSALLNELLASFLK